MKLKLSKYTFYFENKNGYYLYNSYSGYVANITDVKAKKVFDLFINGLEIDTEQIDDASQIIIGQFLEKGFVCHTTENEFQNAIFMYNSNNFGSRKLNLCLIPNRNCNFKCIYCYENHDSTKNMSNDIYDNIINYIDTVLSHKLYNEVTVAWFGGEPLLSLENIKCFMDRASMICKKHGVGLSGSMTTNGYLLTKSVFEELVELHINQYQITIDGTAESHNLTRKLRNGLGTWDVIWKNILNINDFNGDFTVNIRVNYSMKYIDSVIEFLDKYASKLSSKFMFDFHTIFSTGEDGEQDILENNELQTDYITAEISDIELTTYAIQKGLRTIGMLNSIDTTSGCYASQPNHFVIDYDGTLRKCTVALENEINNVGKLTSIGLEIDNAKMSLWTIPPALTDKKCIDCQQLPICYKNKCPLASIKNQNACFRDEFIGDKVYSILGNRIKLEEIRKRLTSYHE